MKKIACCLFVIVSTATVAECSPPWIRTCGGAKDDILRAISATREGGFLCAGGTTAKGAGSTDVLLVNMSATGEVIWQKRYGGASDDEGFSLTATSDGGYLVGAETTSFGAGDSDLWLMKLDPTGNVEWQTVIGGPKGEDVNQVKETSDGKYLVLADTVSFGAGDLDVLLIEVDSSGAILRQKTFGGPDSEYARRALLLADGRVLLVGATKSSGAGGYDAWLMLLDADWKTAWSRTYGTPYWDWGMDVVAGPGGDFIVAGITKTTESAEYDLMLLRVSKSGAARWKKRYGGSGYERPTALIALPDGRYLVSGYTDSYGAGQYDGWMLKFDATGKVLFQRAYGGSGYDYFTSATTSADGGIAVVGRTESYGSAQNDNGWVLKADANGGLGSACAPLVHNTTAAAIQTPLTVLKPNFTSATASCTVTSPSVKGKNSKLAVSDPCAAQREP